MKFTNDVWSFYSVLKSALFVFSPLPMKMKLPTLVQSLNIGSLLPTGIFTRAQIHTPIYKDTRTVGRRPMCTYRAHHIPLPYRPNQHQLRTRHSTLLRRVPIPERRSPK